MFEITFDRMVMTIDGYQNGTSSGDQDSWGYPLYLIATKTNYFSLSKQNKSVLKLPCLIFPRQFSKNTSFFRL